MDVDETMPNLSKEELRELVSNDNLFIFPIKMKADEANADQLTTLQYMQKLQLLFSLTVWSLN
jgi:hypothetical protein